VVVPSEVDHTVVFIGDFESSPTSSSALTPIEKLPQTTEHPQKKGKDERIPEHWMSVKKAMNQTTAS
jgi:hypothetical protein